MDEWETQINEARILLQGDAVQFEKGIKLLQQVMTAADGTVWARRAHEILVELETPRASTPPDEKLHGWQLELASFVSLFDHRLPGFLRRLQAEPTRALQLQPQVSNRLRHLIEELLPRMQAGLTQEEFLQLHQFSVAALGVAAYEELPEFGQLRHAFFQLQFQQTSAQVAEQLRHWALDEAWKALDALGPAPDGFKADLERLQAEIYQAAQLQQTVQELLRQFSHEAALPLTAAETGLPESWPEGCPETWSSARLLSVSLQKLQPYLASERVPDEWRTRLAEAEAGGRAALQRFLQRQAQTALGLLELREFQAEFQRLAPVLEQQKEWFQPAMAGIVQQAQQQVERATRVEELAVLEGRLRQESAGLPPTAARVLDGLVQELSQLGSAWKTLRNGEAFTLPPEGRLTPPTVLRELAVQYGEWLSALKVAFEQLKTAAHLSSPELYQEGLELATEILAQATEHRLARKLQLEAKRRLACYQLDGALARWEISEFLQLFEAGEQDGLYALLAESAEELEALADLTRQPVLTTWQAASTWWAKWRISNRQLTAQRPDALQQALVEHETRRRQQWYAVLGDLLAAEAPPQEYQDAAVSLEGETDEANLQLFRSSLLLRATAGRVKLHLRQGELEAAEEELRKLPPEQTETDRLRTQLQVARARVVGGSALAELLWREWYKVQTFVEEPYTTLREALHRAWEAGDVEALLKVRQILTRVRTSHDYAASNALAELAEWESWLTLEQNLQSENWPRYLTELFARVKEQEAVPSGVPRQRLEKLLQRWRKQENTLGLAWAYQAFQRFAPDLMPLPDPTEQLQAESDRAAERVQRALSQEAALTLAELKEFRTELHAEEHRWRDLQDYLRLLPHTVRRVHASKTFERTKEVLEQTLHLAAELERLQTADLRAEAERLRTLHHQVRQLEGVALRIPLQQTLERLAPLAALGFLELRMREAAEACGSTDPRDVLALGYFARLAETVNHLIRQFAEVGAEGSPMWKLVTAEYETLVHQTARLLTPRLRPPDLHHLVGLLYELEAEDAAFKQALDRLLDPETQPSVPAGGPFDPAKHAAYLALLPHHSPRTCKTWLRFDRGAHTEPLWTILDRSRTHLPSWVREYLNEGMPECASER